MPLYEYRCRDCNHRFEVLQRMGDGPEGLLCPKCGAQEPSRQFSTFATAATTSGSAMPSGGCGAPACGTGFT